jgi:hypothetical protein
VLRSNRPAPTHPCLAWLGLQRARCGRGSIRMRPRLVRAWVRSCVCVRAYACVRMRARPERRYQRSLRLAWCTCLAARFTCLDRSIDRSIGYSFATRVNARAAVRTE